MIAIKEKANCCGCGACAQICPKKCIAMVADAEGFLYPQVEKEACVQCGICRQVCPILAEKKPSGDYPQVYAAYARDRKIRAESSSGGIFSLLAEWVLQQGGIVFGAAFDDDFSVHHIAIASAAELYKLRGSKYLQSRVENTYAEAKSALEEGKMVLYSGVGCQIAGLKAFLRKDYETLYTVDVLCHGVPSPDVWNHYLQKQSVQFDSEIADVSFRSKNTGWKTYSEEQLFKNGEKYSKEHSQDPYIQCFLSDICLRPSCYSCKFRKGCSGADLTLGDAWGIENWMPEMDDDLGTSVVLVNNEKGSGLWNRLAGVTCSKAGNPEEILRYNPVYFKSVSPHPKRQRFFSAMAGNATMAELERLSRKPLHRRILSFGKRVAKSLLRKIKIL